MQGSDILTVVAEISVALAGFSGVVVAFRQQGLESWPAHEFVRFRTMLETASYSILFSLLPFLPHHLGVSPESTWTYCSFALSAGLFSFLAVTLMRLRGGIGQRLSAFWISVYIGGCALFAALALVNALGLTGPPQLGLYLAGVFWMLFYSVSLFVRMVLAPGIAGSNS